MIEVFNNRLQEAGLNDCLIALDHVSGKLQVGFDNFSSGFIESLDQVIDEGHEKEAEVLISERLKWLRFKRENCNKLFDQGDYEDAEKHYKLYLDQVRKGADPESEQRCDIALRKKLFEKRKGALCSFWGKMAIACIAILLVVRWVNGSWFNQDADRIKLMEAGSPNLVEWMDYRDEMMDYKSFFQGVLLSRRDEDRLKTILPKIELHLACKTEMNKVESLTKTGAYFEAEQAYIAARKKYPEIYNIHSKNLLLSRLVLSNSPADIKVNYIRDGQPFEIFEVRKDGEYYYPLIGEGQRTITFSTPGKIILPQTIEVVPGQDLSPQIKILEGAGIIFVGENTSITVHNDSGDEIGRVGSPIDGLDGGFQEFILKGEELVPKTFRKYLTQGSPFMQVNAGEFESAVGRLRFVGDKDIIIKDLNGVVVAKVGDSSKFQRGPITLTYSKIDHEDVTRLEDVIPGVETQIDLPALESNFGDILITHHSNWEIIDPSTNAKVGKANERIARQRTGRARRYLFVNKEHPNGVLIKLNVLPGMNEAIKLEDRFPKVGEVKMRLKILNPSKVEISGFDQWQYRLNDGNWEIAKGSAITRALAFGSYNFEAAIPDFELKESSFKLALSDPSIILDLDLIPKPIRIPVTCSPRNAKIRFDKKSYIFGDVIPLRPYADNFISFFADGYDIVSTNHLFSPHEKARLHVTMKSKDFWEIDALRLSEDSRVLERVEIGLSKPPPGRSRLPLDLTIVIDDPIRSNRENREKVYSAARGLLRQLDVNDRYCVFISGRNAEDSPEYQTVTSDRTELKKLRDRLTQVSARLKPARKSVNISRTYDSHRAISRALNFSRQGGQIRQDAIQVIVVMLNHSSGKIQGVRNTEKLANENEGKYSCRLIVFSDSTESDIQSSIEPLNRDLFYHPMGPILACSDSDPKRLSRYATELVNIYAKNLEFYLLASEEGATGVGTRIDAGYYPYLSTGSSTVYEYSINRPSKAFRLKCNWDGSSTSPYEFEYSPEYKQGRQE